jgi:uncharacterized membrane protein
MKRLLYPVMAIISPVTVFAQGFGPGAGICTNCLGADAPGVYIFWIALGLIMIVAGYKLVRNRRNNAKDDPIAIAARRYAAGEIDRQEYIRLKKDLE